jgi:hypothetical protein
MTVPVPAAGTQAAVGYWHAGQASDWGAACAPRAVQWRMSNSPRAVPSKNFSVAASRRTTWVVPLTPPKVMDTVLTVYRETAPSVELPVTLASLSELLDQLTADRIDLAVIHLPTGTPGTESLVIASGSFGMVMSATDELATRTSLALRDLRGRQVLMTSAKVHPSVVGAHRAAFLNAGVTHLVDLPHNDVVQTAARVLRTGALTLTVLGDDDLPATRVFSAPSFRVVPLDEPGLVLRAGIAWRKEAAETVPGPREVLAALKQRYEDDPMSVRPAHHGCVGLLPGGVCASGTSAEVHSAACRRGTAAAHRSAPSRPQQRPLALTLAMLALAFLTALAALGAGQAASGGRRAGRQAGTAGSSWTDRRPRKGRPADTGRPPLRRTPTPTASRARTGRRSDPRRAPPPCPQVSPVRRPAAEKILTCSGCSSCPACARLLRGWAQGAVRAGGPGTGGCGAVGGGRVSVRRTGRSPASCLLSW